eukprot:2676190-Amphidinium_carterae.4
MAEGDVADFSPEREAMEDPLPDFDGEVKVEQQDAVEAGLQQERDVAGTPAQEVEGVGAPADQEMTAEEVPALVQAVQQPVGEEGAGLAHVAALETAAEVTTASAEVEQNATVIEPAGAGGQATPAHVEEQSIVRQVHVKTARDTAQLALATLVWEKDDLDPFVAGAADILGEVREGVHNSWDILKEHYPDATTEVWLEIWHSTFVAKRRYQERVEFVLKQYRPHAVANLAKSQRCIQGVQAAMLHARQMLTRPWKALQGLTPNKRQREAWEALLMATSLPIRAECEKDYKEKKAKGLFEDSGAKVEKEQHGSKTKRKGEEASGSDNTWDDWGTWKADKATSKDSNPTSTEGRWTWKADEPGASKDSNSTSTEGCWSWSKDSGWTWFTPPTMEKAEESSSEDEEDEEEEEAVPEKSNHADKRKAANSTSTASASWERFGWLDGLERRVKRKTSSAPWRSSPHEATNDMWGVTRPMPPQPPPPPQPPVSRHSVTGTPLDRQTGIAAPWREPSMTHMAVPPPPCPRAKATTPTPPPAAITRMIEGGARVPTPPPPPSRRN